MGRANNNNDNNDPVPKLTIDVVQTNDLQPPQDSKGKKGHGRKRSNLLGADVVTSLMVPSPRGPHSLYSMGKKISDVLEQIAILVDQKVGIISGRHQLDVALLSGSDVAIAEAIGFARECGLDAVAAEAEKTVQYLSLHSTIMQHISDAAAIGDLSSVAAALQRARDASVPQLEFDAYEASRDAARSLIASNLLDKANERTLSFLISVTKNMDIGLNEEIEQAERILMRWQGKPVHTTSNSRRAHRRQGSGDPISASAASSSSRVLRHTAASSARGGGSSKRSSSGGRRRHTLVLSPKGTNGHSSQRSSNLGGSKSRTLKGKSSSSASSSSSSAAAGEAVRLKCHMDGSDDMFVIVVPRNVSYQQLQQKVKDKWSMGAKESTAMRYKDEDGDMITIANQDDLELAFQQLPGGKGQKMHLFLTRSSAASNPKGRPGSGKRAGGSRLPTRRHFS
eukprot:TRINITY_DN66079_c7_g3_i1.p1 TRINITY_DN66079_c7_g3~~TRINITY_DN66079_c7_g3_i1.p1  ORF type:complete len:452 (+),score=220.27 TRINITY_DN66079_c7_g3_i1:373-1728(+)